MDINTLVSFDDIREHMSYGFTWHTPNEDYSNIINDKWWEFMNKHFYNVYIAVGVDSAVADMAVKKIRKIIKKKENYNLYIDVINTLVVLREKGIMNVILSNNYPDLEEVICELNIREYFNDIIVSAKEGYDKPRREIFDIAKNKYPNSKYYMVGDSVSSDIVGGNKAGMKTILVHKGYNELADYCFDDLSSIKGIFE